MTGTNRHHILFIFLASLVIASPVLPATIIIEAETFDYSYDYMFEPIFVFPNVDVPSGLVLLGLDAPDEYVVYLNIQVGVAGIYTITLSERGSPLGMRFVLDAILTNTVSQAEQTVEIMFDGAGTT
jgi:hypothetical protein